MMVDAWNVLGATILLVEFGVLATTFTDESVGLVIVFLLTVHGWTVAVTDGGDGGARFEFTGVALTEEGG